MGAYRGLRVQVAATAELDHRRERDIGLIRPDGPFVAEFRACFTRPWRAPTFLPVFPNLLVAHHQVDQVFGHGPHAFFVLIDPFDHDQASGHRNHDPGCLPRVQRQAFLRVVA